MAHTSLVHRAKQGDAAAIATLINRHASGLGVVAQVTLQQHCLHVILEGQEPPPQLFWSHYLKRSLYRLGNPSITQLHLYGRAYGVKRAAWNETLDLAQVSDAADQVQATVPLPDALPVTQQYCAPPSPSTQPNNASDHAPASVSNGPWEGAKHYYSPAAAAVRATAVRATGASLKSRSSLRPNPSPKQSYPRVRRGRAWYQRWLPQLQHPDIFTINGSLARQWAVGTLGTGLGAVALYAWGIEAIPPLLPFTVTLPIPEGIIAGILLLSWVLGWIQAAVLKGWVDFSGQWIPVTAAGWVGAYIVITITHQGPDLALPLVALLQYLALQRWCTQAYRWILAHLAMAIAVRLSLPVISAIVATMEWGRDFAFDLSIDYRLAIHLTLLWLVYSLGSALVIGKFYAPHRTR